MTVRGLRGFATLLLLTVAAACNAYVEPGNYSTGTPPMLVVGQPAARPTASAGQNDAAPPANVDPDVAGVAPAMAGSRSGVYGGVIEPIDTGGGRCTSTQTVRDFRVSGTTVHWRQFRGHIVGNGLQMRHGNDWLIGDFLEGDQFSGQIGAYGNDQPSGCSWRIRLSKIGS